MTEVPIDDYDRVENTLDRICKCGHKLSYHGFNDYMDYSTGQHFFVVSICLFCGSEKCPRFEAEEGISK